MNGLLYAVVLLLVGAGAYLVRWRRLQRRERNPERGLEPIEVTTVERVTIADVIQWFRQHQDVPIRHPHALAVMLRSLHALPGPIRLTQPMPAETPLTFYQGFFDQEKNALVCLRTIHANSADDSLLEMFRGKELVILK